MNYPFQISNYTDEFKKILKVAIKIIDHEGDPDWCSKYPVLCAKNTQQILILEYKRRILRHLIEILENKTIPQIINFMKPISKKKFAKFKDKKKLICHIGTHMSKRSWKQLNLLRKNNFC